MAKKFPTAEQSTLITLIETGVPREHLAEAVSRDAASLSLPASAYLDVNSFQWSRDGFCVLVHRTVLKAAADRQGDPRHDYRTEIFRIAPDGAVSRL